MVLHHFSTGRPRAWFWLGSVYVDVKRDFRCLIVVFEMRNEYAFDCDRARAAYDGGMRALGAVLFSIVACGGGQDAKPPHTDQTTESDAGASVTATDAASDALATNAQTDAAVAQTSEAGTSDDVDKSVSVCGDEAIPIEKRVRKKVKECWSTAATKNPALDGHVSVKFVIDPHGKITKTTIAQEKTLGADTTTCVTAAINAYKLDGTKCSGKTVGFEMAFGRAAKD